MKTQIIYEDKEILVIYKPAGLATQSARIAQTDVVSELNTYLMAGNSGKPAYLGLIHRLDQPVEGLLVFAKDKKSAAALSAQFADGKKPAVKPGAGGCEKIYYAAACPENGWERVFGEVTLTGYMAKDSRTNLARIVDKDTPQAKKAVLVYEVLEQKGNLVLLRVRLQTGRFHQIRAQLANAGLPLLGDHKYGTEEAMERSKELSVKTVALCASELVFTHPASGKEVRFTKAPENVCFGLFEYFKTGKEA